MAKNSALSCSSFGDKYTVYHISIQVAGGPERIVYKRFHDFREFHEAWGKLYSGLREQIQLPNAHVLFKNRTSSLFFRSSTTAFEVF